MEVLVLHVLWLQESKKILSVTKNKKKKHNKVFMFAASKLNSIKTLISQALIDLEISHEEFKTTVNEKEKYEKKKKKKLLEWWKVVIN